MATLNAWMNGEWVGTWQVTRGTHSFTYAPSWLESGKSRPLSLSLPITRALEIKGGRKRHHRVVPEVQLASLPSCL